MYPATALAPSQDRVLALANLLVFLGQHQYPAERVVRTVDGSLTTQSEQWHMLVTTYAAWEQQERSATQIARTAQERIQALASAGE